MSIQKPILYFRGLNSGKSDNLHFGAIPLPFHMAKPWVDFLESNGVEVFAVEGMGFGPIEGQIERALSYLEKHRKELNEGFHLVGHSAGGLVAWSVAANPEWKNKVLSLTTLATPHNGAALADWYLEKLKAKSAKLKLLDKIGYDSEPRFRTFQDFTPKGLTEFKLKYQPREDLPIASFCFSAKAEEMTWPIKLLISLNILEHKNENDGFIELTTQTVGKNLGHYKLDHLSQIGYHWYLSPKQKAEKAKLFQEVGLGLLKHLEQVELSR